MCLAEHEPNEDLSKSVIRHIAIKIRYKDSMLKRETPSVVYETLVDDNKARAHWD